MSIRFDESQHRYFFGDTELHSVSSVVNRFVPKFDSDRISRKISARDGRPQSEILAEWDAKREKGLSLGTAVHSYIERSLAGLAGDEMADVNEPIPECVAFHKAWNALREKWVASLLWQEQVVYSVDLGVAGRVDALISMPSGEMRTIDWKTGKFSTGNRFERMLPPFHGLPNCEHVKYSIQSSLYRVLLEKQFPEMRFGDGVLAHLMPDETYRFYKVIDFRDGLIAYLGNRSGDETM